MLSISHFQSADNYYADHLACISIDNLLSDESDCDMASANFYTITLITEGEVVYSYRGKQEIARENQVIYSKPFAPLQYLSRSVGSHGHTLIVEPAYYDAVLRLDENLFDILNEISTALHPAATLSSTKTAELQDFYLQIERTIKQTHTFKDEMLKHLVHVFQLFIAEMVNQHVLSVNDMRHKENIYRVFIHEVRRHFRTERQIKFYADMLNITPTYLSRTVKEISGNTVYTYISSVLYNEICRLLVDTDKTMNEIAFELNFSDASALSNFFKQKMGVSPMAFRRAKMKKKE